MKTNLILFNFLAIFPLKIDPTSSRVVIKWKGFHKRGFVRGANFESERDPSSKNKNKVSLKRVESIQNFAFKSW